MRRILIAAAILMLAGCGLQLRGGPNTPTDFTTRVYDAFYPQPNVQVALASNPPGMTDAQAGPFVAERMKGPSTYGINFAPPGKEAFGDQVATWSFTPTDGGGVRVECVMTERGRRMVMVAGTAPNATPLALTEAIRLLTQNLYGQIAQVRF
jgi:hypothetical protein